MEVYKYVKGGVWWCNFPENQPQGLIQGRHMAIIISGTVNPSSACTLTVLPISSMNSSKHDERKLRQFYCVPIEIYKSCFVCCNQPTTIIASQLHNYVGQVNGYKLQMIEDELMRYFQFYVKSESQCASTSSEYPPNTLEKSGDNCTIEENKDMQVIEKLASKTKKITRPRHKVLVVETGEVFPSVRSCYMHFNVPRAEVENAVKKCGTIYSELGHFHVKYLNN